MDRSASLNTQTVQGFRILIGKGLEHLFAKRFGILYFEVGQTSRHRNFAFQPGLIAQHRRQQQTPLVVELHFLSVITGAL